jgi:hypothetical protein
MENDFQHRFKIEPLPKSELTNVTLEISAKAVFRNLSKFDFGHYFNECHLSLKRVAAQESVEIVVSSVDLDFEHEWVVHRVCMRGVWRGLEPLRIMRALRPPPGYWDLDFLRRGVEKDWPMEPALKARVEYQGLKRYDHTGKRLEEPIPQQLLARAVTETHWGLLISPSDKPWAYISTATKQLYERLYPEDDPSEDFDDKVDVRQSLAEIATSDEREVVDFPGLCRAASLPEDSVLVLEGLGAGKTWRELPEYLTKQTGASFGRRRVEAARGNLRRRKSELREIALAASHWKPRWTRGMGYRERVPDGALWGGLSTYAHRYQGKELDIMAEVMRQERSKLFRKT